MKIFRLTAHNELEEISRADLTEFVNSPWYQVTIIKVDGASMTVRTDLVSRNK